MLRQIYRSFPCGTILASLYLVVPILWVLVAFGNPWHQGLLALVDFPASYLVLGADGVFARIIPEHPALQNILTDACFIAVGTVWFFIIGAVLQKGVVFIWHLAWHRKH